MISECSIDCPICEETLMLVDDKDYAAFPSPPHFFCQKCGTLVPQSALDHMVSAAAEPGVNDWCFDMSLAPKDRPILAASWDRDISVVKFGGNAISYQQWHCLADGRHAIESECDFGTTYINIRAIAWRYLPELPKEIPA